MAIYLLEMPRGSTRARVGGVNQMVVSAESAADAKLIAASQYSGDSVWSDSDDTALTDVTFATAAAMVGWRFTIQVTGTTEDSVTVTGDVTDDTLDEIGTELAVQLNTMTEIAGASYTTGTQTLIVALGSGNDDLGDQTVRITIYPPIVTKPGGRVNQDVDMETVFVSSITHEGVSSADLTVVFNADTTVLPVVVAEGKQ